MAKEWGSWSISFTVEPNETDLEHIGEMVKQGYLSGEIAGDDDE